MKGPSRRSALAVLGLMLAASIASPGAVAALTPNQSIILYRPGKAILGTLAAGVFTKTGSQVTTGWTDIAVGRDTLVMYRKGDGKVRTGRFRGGKVTQARGSTLKSGYSHVAASCDTVLFYDRKTGKGFTAPIGDGRIILAHKHAVNLGKNLRLIEASCDTAILLRRADGVGNVTVKVGTLESGRYTDHSTGQQWPTPTRLAATSDSFVAVDVPDSTGSWGTAIAGAVNPTGSAFDFASFWDIIAGSPDTLYFYDRGAPLGAVSLLSGGGYFFVGALPNVPPRLKLVAAGR